MTTIAYKDGVIAYDSRACAGYTIVDDDCDKRIESGCANFFLTGKPAHFNILIGKYFGEEADLSGVDLSAIVYEKEVLYLVCIYDGNYYKHEIEKKKPCAIGSGQDHAWTAMDLGNSSKEAVKMAKLRDCGTGGKIRTFNV